MNVIILHIYLQDAILHSKLKKWIMWYLAVNLQGIVEKTGTVKWYYHEQLRVWYQMNTQW